MDTAEPERASARRHLVVGRAALASGTRQCGAARIDLEHRREGDVLGAAQSGGRTSLRFLRVLRDEDVIARAREDGDLGAAEQTGKAALLATGFDSGTGAMMKVDLRGKSGQRFRDKWADGPCTYLARIMHEV